MLKYLILIIYFVSFGAFADKLSSQSDEFNNKKTLKNWQRVHALEKTPNQLKVYDINKTKKGYMTLIPYTSVWYNDYRGVLVHKNIAGNFIATTSIIIQNRKGTGAPRSKFSLAGIMVRTPVNVKEAWKPGRENYIFLSFGAANKPGQYQFEVKTTVRSKSKLEIINAPSNQVLIRTVRLGKHFILLRKFPKENWVVHRRYYRPDMPKTLQVGLTCYTDWSTCSKMRPAKHNVTLIKNGNPDLVASIDYFRFKQPVIPAKYKGIEFSKPSAISNKELLKFLSR